MDLRDATAEDAPFIYHVYEMTARPLVEAAGKRWAERGMREKSQQESVDGITQIVSLAGKNVGFFSIEHRASDVWLHSLYLLPQFQRKSVGKLLLLRAVEDANGLRVPLRCRVMSFNPAVNFYKHLGFSVVADEGQTFLLERESAA